MQSELLPCPWCGVTPVRRRSIGEDFGIYCMSPGCYVQPCVTSKIGSEEAVGYWNRRASPWRPISEAPHDGTRVDVWNGRRYTNVMYLDDNAIKGWCFKVDATECEDDYFVYLDPQPTHFMSLPEGPTSTIRNKD